MLIDSAFKFSLECLKKCMLIKPTNTVFLSPHLLYQNLLATYFGVTDDVEKDFLRQVLYIPDNVCKDNLKEHYCSKGVHLFCYEVSNFRQRDWRQSICVKVYEDMCDLSPAFKILKILKILLTNEFN